MTIFRAIITDLDGVIRFFPNERDKKIEEHYHLPSGILGELAFEPALLEKVITGKISDQIWRKTILENLENKYPKHNCKEAIKDWSNFPGEIDHKTLNILKSTHLPLVLLTNATDRLEEDLKAANVFHQFDRIFNSSELRVIKPDPMIFKKVCNSLGINEKEALFIDDSKRNVQSAEGLGMKGIHFTDLQSLQSQLKILLQ